MTNNTPYDKEKIDEFVRYIRKEIESLEFLISRCTDGDEKLRCGARKKFYESILWRISLGGDLPKIKTLCEKQHIMSKCLLKAQRQICAQIEMIMRDKNDRLQTNK